MSLTKSIFIVCSILLSIELSSCKGNDPIDQAALPTNLVVTVEFDDIIQGKVIVSATASNANFYSFTFEDQANMEYIETPDGVAEHTYQQEGDFNIIVRAHATQVDYIESTEVVSISFSPPVDENDAGYVTPISYPGYSLTWNDEFDGATLSEASWNYELGTGNNGWGNNELQFYRRQNTSIIEGKLVIEAKRENFDGMSYTSSRLTTQGKHAFQYGRIDIRAKMPFGQGIWPALWMLGENFPTAGWPFCGEIDIMEMVGGNVSGGGDDVVHGTVHWDNAGQYASFTDSKRMSNRLADSYHVYTIIWDENEIAWFIDDQQYHSIDITPAALSEFHQPYFFIFNIAVGGNWPGSPNEQTSFPQYMLVDYVRVFQKD